MAQITDDMLISRCKDHDTGAFRLLVERYRQPAYTFAFSYMRNDDDAFAVSQDAFVRAWKAMDSFIEGRRFGPWLFSIVKRLALNLIDKRRRRREVSLDEAVESYGYDAPDPSANTARYAEERDTARRVRGAVMELKEEFREVIVLKHFQDLTYGEIAEALGIPVGTVMSRLYYARKELKKNIAAVTVGVDDNDSG
jgi:RNA polymerase sigma-70 factor, ECF subfamily